MTKPPPASSTTTGDTARVWKGNIFLDPLHLALCVAVLKHLLLTNLFLDSIHSYFVSSQAKICQIHFWILVKNFFSFFGLPTLNFVFDNAQALVFGLVCVCVCVLGPLQSFTVQTLNDISLFNGVSQFDKVCGGRLRREMRF